MAYEVASFQVQIKSSLTSLAEELAQGKSDRLQRLLQFASRFHHYSLGNQFLIASQCPWASYVAGYKTWRSLGFQVAKGQKGIRILAPMPWRRERPDGEIGEGVSFKVVAVFDASQLTDDKPLPRFFEPLPDDERARCAQVEAALTKEGLRVEEATLRPDQQGYFTPVGRRIIVRAGIDSHSRFLVLLHEWGHAILHPECHDGHRERQELQAEATSYVVAQHFGVDHPFAADYLATWHATPAELEAQLAAVLRAATHIIGALTPAATAAAPPTTAPRPPQGRESERRPETDELIEIIAVMLDGTQITEVVRGEREFVAMLRSFKRDPDVVTITWRALDEELDGGRDQTLAA